ncbi:MAG: lysoplasmalogenase [Bacteroidales bacterium]|jgi:hypothetical protein|nr:lysoplasmalogenase [Bacteroidales bacterium]
MKNYLFLLLLIPITAACLAVLGFGYAFHLILSLSCIIIVLVFPEEEVKTSAWLIALSFLISIAGDWMLGHRANFPDRFIYGIGLYFLAHIGYLSFCIRNGRVNILLLALSLVGYGIFFMLKLKPAISDDLLLISVLLYLIISCCTLAASLELSLSPTSRWLFFIGILSLVFSDTLIALHEFVRNDTLYFLMMPTFYASHIFITAAMMRKNNESLDENT